MHFKGVDFMACELYLNIKRTTELEEGGKQVLSLGPEEKLSSATQNMPFGEISLSWLFLRTKRVKKSL